MARPDLAGSLQSVAKADPIPDEPPPDFFKKEVDEIEDIGEPINACFYINSRTNPTNWLVLFAEIVLFVFLLMM